jgi:hypothetical protein
MFSLPDRDVFAIDATTLRQTASRRASSILFNRRESGNGSVASRTRTPATTCASKDRAAAEAPCRDTLHEARISVLSGAQVKARHLCKHIDYSVRRHHDTKNHSLATPVQIVVSAERPAPVRRAFGSARSAS